MKKYRNTVPFAKITVLFSMLFTTLVTAQEVLPDAPDDTVTAPIDNYVWVLALIGLVFVFLRFKVLRNSNKFIK
ncbi:MAG: hypothetical protein GZ087_01685 [Flavobacterium sp.]|nr:hypothetical protein [Flavobacterium sp.]